MHKNVFEVHSSLCSLYTDLISQEVILLAISIDQHDLLTKN